MTKTLTKWGVYRKFDNTLEDVLFETRDKARAWKKSALSAIKKVFTDKKKEQKAMLENFGRLSKVVKLHCTVQKNHA